MSKGLPDLVWAWGSIALLAAALAVSGVSCDSGSGGGGSSGGSAMLTGNVVSFNMGSAYYHASPHERLFAQAFAAVCDFWVSPAEAAAAGVYVSVMGTSLGATTVANGAFSMAGVPSGKQEIVFSMGAHSSILELDIPPDVTVELRDVVVAPAGVTVGQLLLHSTTQSVVTVSSGGSSGSSRSQPTIDRSVPAPTTPTTTTTTPPAGGAEDESDDYGGADDDRTDD